jgi:hypothetical protein
LQEELIGFVPLLESHTGKNMAIATIAVLQQYDLIKVVSDNNMSQIYFDLNGL